MISGFSEISLDLRLEKVVQDDRCDNDPEQCTGPGCEQAPDAGQDADGREDNSDNPDPWPGLETTNPKEEVDDPE